MPGFFCLILLYMVYSKIHGANDWCGHDSLCCVKLLFFFEKKKKKIKKIKMKRKSSFIVQFFFFFFSNTVFDWNTILCRSMFICYQGYFGKVGSCVNMMPNDREIT